MLDNFGIELQPEEAARTFETIDKDGNGVTHPIMFLLHPLSCTLATSLILAF